MLRTSRYDRRRADRFQVSRPVHYLALDSREEGIGQAIDMSSSGVLFSSRSILVPGERVELSISGWTVKDGETTMALVARGRVVRVEKGRAAARIERFEFRPVPEKGEKQHLESRRGSPSTNHSSLALAMGVGGVKFPREDKA